MKKLALAAVAILAAVSAFAFGAPKVALAFSPSCPSGYQESIYSTSNHVPFGSGQLNLSLEEWVCINGTRGQFKQELTVYTSNGDYFVPGTSVFVEHGVDCGSGSYTNIPLGSGGDVSNYLILDSNSWTNFVAGCVPGLWLSDPGSYTHDTNGVKYTLPYVYLANMG